MTKPSHIPAKESSPATKPPGLRVPLITFSPYFYAGLSILACLLLAGFSLWWNLSNIRQQTNFLGLHQAREAQANFSQDLSFRLWTTPNGGVYVPVTESNPPSPYLSHLPERDLTTPSGQKLTLMNPACTPRRIIALHDEGDEVKGHITSLNPLNPDNKPDPWEQKAHKAFEKGTEEVVAYTEIYNVPYLRLLQPLITQPFCLKCHAHQGYQVGDILGGIGVSMPMTLLEQIDRQNSLKIILSHTLFAGLAFLVILLLLVIAKTRLAERFKAAEREMKLQQTQKMEAVGVMASGIAHDFNNILTPIIGYSELLLRSHDEKSTDTAKLREIHIAATRAKELVRQILTFSRQGDTGRQPMEMVPVIKEALKLIRATIPASIEVRPTIDETCGPVVANPTEIHQIVMNLCSNAVHAMRDHGGILKVSLQAMELSTQDLGSKFALKPGKYLRLEVNDNGCGIPRELRERIFEPYFTSKAHSEGTGLGLAVVHGIVKNYGGTITVYSESGVGSTFHVYLPAYQGLPAGGPAVVPAARPGGNERILVVDDEEQIAGMMVAILSSLGYRTTSTGSSLEAFELFTAAPGNYDLLITDQTMPKMSGAELSRKVLTIRPELPIILCTGFSEVIDRDQALALGIKGYLTKPLGTAELALTIRRVLQENHSAD